MYEPAYYCGADINVGIQKGADSPQPITAPYFNISKVTSKEAIFGHNSVLAGSFADGDVLAQGTIAIVLGEEPQWMTDYPYSPLFNLYVEPLKVYNKEQIMIINHVHIQGQQTSANVDGSPVSTIYSFIGVIAQSMEEGEFLMTPSEPPPPRPGLLDEDDEDYDLDIEYDIVETSLEDFVPLTAAPEPPTPLEDITPIVRIRLYQIAYVGPAGAFPVVRNGFDLSLLTAALLSDAKVVAVNNGIDVVFTEFNIERVTSTTTQLTGLGSDVFPTEEIRVRSIAALRAAWASGRTPLATVDEAGIGWLMYIDTAEEVYSDLIGFTVELDTTSPLDVNAYSRRFESIISQKHF